MINHPSFSRFQIFEVIHLMKWLKEVVLFNLNMKLVKKVSIGELIRFMGIRLKIATTVGFERRNFWSVDVEGTGLKIKTPFKFTNIMSKHRFEVILRNLYFIEKAPPAFRDQFYEHREMVEEWNSDMTRENAHSDRVTLDESMKK